MVRNIDDSFDEELSSVIRSTEFIPEYLESYSFDVKIISGGEDDNIVIGLSSATSEKCPGMNQNTIGIYGFDGSICRDAEEVSTASSFTTGDLITCKVIRTKISNNTFTITSCQFSKNGELLGRPMNVGGKHHFPAVGLHSPGAIVQITLNTSPKIGNDVLN